MVTLAFFLVLFGMVLLMTVFNFLVYDHLSLIESFLLLVWFEMGSRRMIVVAAAVVGLMAAIYEDIKRTKSKNQPEQVRLK